MEIPLKLDFVYGGYVLARLTKCRIMSPVETFSGVEIAFELTIEPTGVLGENYPKLENLVIDVYLNYPGSLELHIDRLKDRFIKPVTLSYAREHSQYLRLKSNSFFRLIEETHYRDLELKFRAQILLRLEVPIKNSSGGLLIDAGPAYLSGDTQFRLPHSEWHKVLNNTRTERFDLISLRTSVPNTEGTTAFTQAFDKLREAQDKFNRGDWNAVGSACRSAIRTVMSIAQGQNKPMDYLLSSVIGDPRRKKFALPIKAIWDSLNAATHQEGNVNDQTPPSDFLREDALLCLHLTAAAISYISDAQ